jgi:hypothetical protein
MDEDQVPEWRVLPIGGLELRELVLMGYANDLLEDTRRELHAARLRFVGPSLVLAIVLGSIPARRTQVYVAKSELTAERVSRSVELR